MRLGPTRLKVSSKVKEGDFMSAIKSAPEMGWNFDNSYARLPASLYTRLDPMPVRAPELVVLNEALAGILGFDAEALMRPEGVAVLAGNRIPEGALPLAQAYAGHQFGHFTLLGDGRALLLGEQITPQGDRLDVQLKGSGQTPYSRRGDGRAALGPMLREYIISEAMHALGIPTTRSLAVVTTGEPVYRETQLSGAVLTRVAGSHLRVGTFQFVSTWETKETLKALADYALLRHFPEVDDAESPYLALLHAVIRRQAALVAQWQLVGFIHGVMNTDNMAVSGETIDYGPCAFMNVYDPETVFSSIDTRGRYAYGNQPSIAGWNLARLAESLLPLLHDDPVQAVEIAQKAISTYQELYRSHWLAGMRSKLGIFNQETQDEALFERLLELMQKNKLDYTNTFRTLTLGNVEGTGLLAVQDYAVWHQKWQERLTRQQQSIQESLACMQRSNPAVIPRNHRVEEALKAAVGQGDFSVMERLLSVLSKPYACSAEHVEYTLPPERTDRNYQTFCGT
jgi:uncharacterized protein YdiU (UPF0061 family)